MHSFDARMRLMLERPAWAGQSAGEGEPAGLVEAGGGSGDMLRQHTVLVGQWRRANWLSGHPAVTRRERWQWLTVVLGRGRAPMPGRSSQLCARWA
jgi:hypothetical protein